MAKNAIYGSAWSADHEKMSIGALKIQFSRFKIFSSDIEVKKISLKLESRIGKIAGYDSAWCADHQKLFVNPSKN